VTYFVTSSVSVIEAAMWSYNQCIW